jgi:hypothetical protein
MKKWIGIAAVLGLVGLFLGGYPTSPLHGTLKAVTVTKKYFQPVHTPPSEYETQTNTVHIQDPEQVARIEKSIGRVWNHWGPINSMEGIPRYSMHVQYADGGTDSFNFTRTEWSGKGRTPKSLLKELEKHGL